MKGLRRLLLVPLLALLAIPGASADELHLKNGNVLEGTLVRETETHYVFRVTGMGEQEIAKDQVREVVRTKTVYGEYLEKRKAVDEDDAEARYRLGLWCEEHELREEAEKEFEAAVEADPDHPGARRKLGFVRFEEEWVTERRRWQLLEEIGEENREMLEKLVLLQTITSYEAHFRFQIPAGNARMIRKSGTHLVFVTPELRGVPIVIEFEATPAGGSLSEMAEAVAKSVKKDDPDARADEPEEAELADRDARLLSFTWVRDDLGDEGLHVERHDLFTATPKGNFRFALVCRAGWWDLLKPFFDRMVSSFEIVG
jgi:hypothetical protein